MDGETAIAFAGSEFERLHPRETCPDWLPRCTAIGYTLNSDGNFLIYFTVTRIASDEATVYFQAVVDARTAKVKILIDSVPSSFDGSDFIGY